MTSRSVASWSDSRPRSSETISQASPRWTTTRGTSTPTRARNSAAAAKAAFSRRSGL